MLRIGVDVEHSSPPGECSRHGLDHHWIAPLRHVRHGFEQGHGSTLRCWCDASGREPSGHPRMSTTARSRLSSATSPRAGAASTPATRSSPRRSSTASRAKKAYLYGQAPGIVEGAEGAPWRGRAGSTLRRWLELDEETFYSTFYCASVTRCYPGRTAGGRGDRTPTPAERRLCGSWREEELRLLRPDLILTVGGLAAHAIIGVKTLTECVGKSYVVDDAIVIPLPHPSGASAWPNDTEQSRAPRQGAHPCAARARTTRRPKRVCEDDRMSDEDTQRISTRRSSTASKARSRPRRFAKRA